MKSKTHLILTGAMAFVAAAAIPASAQSQNIQARISGGSGNGKCTVEVVVQGSADVQIRGNQGTLRTLSGNPAQWRRLDCNQPLPANPSNFKFAGVDGHGRQGLAADPNSNNGVAVIHIENTTGSNEGYTADITWSGGNNSTGNVWVPGNENTNDNWIGQSQNIRARISGGGGNGKCTFEVALSGTAEIQIQGDQWNLRTLSGNQAQWHRLDCNQPLPRQPSNLRLSGVDGRGQQSLTQNPGTNNGVAVVRIQNTTGGTEGFTGDITWDGGNNTSDYRWGAGTGNPNENWNGQSQNIRASISGNGGRGNGSGRCTFEVALNGTAEIQIQGDQGNLRTLTGSPAQWRRLDCNQVLPRQPGNLQFSGSDRYGQQSQTQNSSTNNGITVFQIDNRSRGSQGYTGAITWNDGNGNWGNNGPYPFSDGGNNWDRTSANSAVQGCQDTITARVRSDHRNAKDIQISQDDVRVSRGSNDLASIQGAGLYRSNKNGNPRQFTYNCVFNTRSGQLTESTYQ